MAETTDTPPPPAGDAAAPAGTGEGADLGRRRFFRQFAGDLANTAATMIGAAQALQRTSAELAGAILDPTRAALEDAQRAEAERAAAGTDADAPAYRTSFRFDGTAIRFVDQRALPRAVTEHITRSAAEVSWAIRNEVVIGGPAAAQAAALGLALTAARIRNSRPYARRATLRGAANALRNAAPTTAAVSAAVDRVVAAYEAVGELTDDGEAVAAAMLAEAERVVAEATEDHGRLLTAGLALLDGLPRPAEGPLRLLVHGPSGTLGGGQAGTALSIAIAAHHADREIRVFVPEGRPNLAGARIACWELAAQGVPHVLVPDAAAPALVAGGEIDAVLVAAERVASNGDVAATVGTYGLAAAAARAGTPLVVALTASSVDPATPSGPDIAIATRATADLDRIGDLQIAPRGTEVRAPLFDVTPAELVTTYVGADGVVGPPFAAPREAEPAAAAPEPAAAGPEPASAATEHG